MPAPYREHRLASLQARCAQCEACPLHAGRTHSVFADGNPHARIMLIGEGPGYNEDQQGRPFVGRAGQLLDQMLASVKLRRQEHVYIANMVKCRPPENRNPSPEEMRACFKYLRAQIDLVQPWILILSGSIALKGLFPEAASITRSRGQWREWQGIHCMPIFHPAYLLRNDAREKGSPKWLTWQDLKAVTAKYQELSQMYSEHRRPAASARAEKI